MRTHCTGRILSAYLICNAFRVALNIAAERAEGRYTWNAGSPRLDHGTEGSEGSVQSGLG
jgi:hypothetical protein